MGEKAHREVSTGSGEFKPFGLVLRDEIQVIGLFRRAVESVPNHAA